MYPPTQLRMIDDVSEPVSRQPEIDGLRALAIIAVVLFHAKVPGVDGGFTGVDVFFVLSGFLITRLLVNEHERTGTISLPAFWSRRFPPHPPLAPADHRGHRRRRLRTAGPVGVAATT